MKILLFTDSLGAGGAQRQLVGLARMLQSSGHRVKVCTYFGADFYKKHLDESEVPNELIPNASNIKRRVWAVRQHFKKELPDWVIAYQETPSLVACMAKLLGCKFKLIVSERNTTQSVGINERVRFFLYHLAQAIVPNSYAQEKWLVDHHSWMKWKLFTITNFVDLHNFPFVKHVRRDVPEIMVAASVWESKNVLGFINACKLLRDMGAKFHCTWYGLIGELTDYQKEAVKLISDLQVEEVFTLEHKTPEIQSRYQDCDYFCLPSFYEGTPNVICEAMATGRPILCSNVCDNPVYVQDGINGCLFDPNNVENIARKINEALQTDSTSYDKMCIRSRNIVEELCSESVFLSKYLKIMELNN